MLVQVVYVELPEVGDEFEAEEAFGSVESVKAASDIYVPCAGKVIECNDLLSEEPGVVNESPISEGWFVKIEIEDPSELEGLMDEDAYAEFLESQ